MEKVVIKPTWQLAWGLWWRLFFINLGIIAIIIGVTYYFVWRYLLALLRGMPMMPY